MDSYQVEVVKASSSNRAETNLISLEMQTYLFQSARMKIRSTTILAVRHKGQVALAGDGQVSLGNTVMKHQARKVRRLYHDKVITGICRSNRRCIYPL